MHASDFAPQLAALKETAASGRCHTRSWRRNQLDALDSALTTFESEILDALQRDLGKPSLEARLTELNEVRQELRFHKARLSRWMKPRRVPTPLLHFGMSSRIHPEPLGCVLIISPWNYPLNLALMPLIGAISAGNTVVLKPSELAPHTADILERIVETAFSPDEVAIIQGGAEETGRLLAHPFDHIFFTGGERVGKIVMEAASRNLTPVTLELGGKSPVIVAEDADLATAARRIIWGKCLNTGQTCVAPDHVFVPTRHLAAFMEALKAAIVSQLGENPALSPDYGRIVSDRHFERLAGLLEESEIFHGGQTDPETRYMAPTLMANPDPGSRLMTEEIFGPILPVLSYDDMEEAISAIRKRPKPLAFYLFTENRKLANTLLRRISSGGACVNDTILHIGSPHLPFGGVGTSGMGSYHGEKSFSTFSHMKSVMTRSFLPEVPFRYAPRPPWAENLMTRVFS